MHRGRGLKLRATGEAWHDAGKVFVTLLAWIIHEFRIEPARA